MSAPTLPEAPAEQITPEQALLDLRNSWDAAEVGGKQSMLLNAATVVATSNGNLSQDLRDTADNLIKMADFLDTAGGQVNLLLSAAAEALNPEGVVAAQLAERAEK